MRQARKWYAKYLYLCAVQYYKHRSWDRGGASRSSRGVRSGTMIFDEAITIQHSGLGSTLAARHPCSGMITYAYTRQIYGTSISR